MTKLGDVPLICAISFFRQQQRLLQVRSESRVLVKSLPSSAARLGRLYTPPTAVLSALRLPPLLVLLSGQCITLVFITSGHSRRHHTLSFTSRLLSRRYSLLVPLRLTTGLKSIGKMAVFRVKSMILNFLTLIFRHPRRRMIVFKIAVLTRP
ncbi:hypothetical protein BJ165DRAFT_234166 [Panaeolus papilionaceus]|nr:hypothetical protein BJ165DRAFT_234166 [Panaeolus papilionaceus]